MEILYFIAGILSVGVIYGIILLRSVKSSHTDLLARHQSQSNISSIRSVDVDEAIEDLRLLVNDIQSNMEKDQYESSSTRIWTSPRMGYVHIYAAVRRHAQCIPVGILYY